MKKLLTLILSLALMLTSVCSSVPYIVHAEEEVPEVTEVVETTTEESQDDNNIVSDVLPSEENDVDNQEDIIPAENDVIDAGELVMMMSDGDDIELQADVKSVPADLKVEETSEGLVISTTDTDYLEDLCKKTVYVDDEVTERGGSVNIRYRNGEKQYYSNTIMNENDYRDGNIVYSKNPITLKSNRAVISATDLVGFYVPNGNCIVDLSVAGYEYVYFSDVAITKGCITDYPEISVSTLSDGSIVINSADKAFLNAIAKFTVDNYKTGEREEGGQMALVAPDDRWFYFSNDSYTYESGYTHSNEPLQIQNDGSTIVISATELLKYGVYSNTEYQIKLYPYGYVRDYDYDKPVYIGKIGKNVTLSIAEDTSGNIHLYAGDEDWTKLVKENNNNSWIVAQRYDAENNEWIDIESFDHYQLSYEQDSLGLRIPNTAVLIKGIKNGSFRIRAHVEGYEATVSNEIVLTHACSEMPADLNVYQNASGDLVVKTSDIIFLKNLAEATYPSYISIDYVRFENYYDDNTAITVNENEGYAIVNNERLKEWGVTNGTNEVKVLAFGYEMYSSSYTFTNCLNEAPEDVEVTMVDGNIVITSADTEYLKALCVPYCGMNWGRGMTDGVVSIIPAYYGPGFGGSGGASTFGYFSISLNTSYDDWDFVNAYFVNRTVTDYDDKELYSEYPISMAKDGKSVIIYSDMLAKYGIVDGQYTISFGGPGYDGNYMSLNVTGSPAKVAPSDVKVTFSKSTGLTITSKDTKWINGLISRCSVDHKRDMIKKDSNTIVIPSSTMINWGVEDAPSYVYMQADGYRNYLYPTTLNIVLREEVPYDLDVTTNANGDLVIKSSDKNYLKTLSQAWTYDGEGDIATAGGSVVLHPVYGFASGNYPSGNYPSGNYGSDNYNGGSSISLWFENYSNYKPLVYNSSKGTITISASELCERIVDYGEMGSGLYEVTLEAPGYHNVNISTEILVIETDKEPVIFTGEDLYMWVGTDAKWSSSNSSVAKVDTNGKVTGIKAGTAIITADYLGVKTTHSVKVMSGSDLKFTVGTEQNVYMVGDSFDVFVEGDIPESAFEAVKFKLSDETIAHFDGEGHIECDAPGKLTVSASIYGKTVNAVINIVNVSTEDTLSVELSDYENSYLEVGDVASLTVKADDSVLPFDLFDYSSNNAKVVTVENGEVSAVAAGTATITAVLKDDPFARKVTFAVKVVNRVAESIEVKSEINSAYVDSDVDTDGNSYVDYDYLTLSKDAGGKLQLSVKGAGTDGFNFVPGVKYTVNDTTVAAVSADGLVTFKKAGQVVVTVTVTTNPSGSTPVVETMILRAIDYSPKFETASVSLNRFKDESAELNVVVPENNEITNATISDNDKFVLMMNPDGEGYIYISDPTNVNAGKYNEIVSLTVNGNIYQYSIPVTVTANLPSVTIKTTGTYNTFTNESTLDMTITSKDADVVNGEFLDDFVIFGDDSKLLLADPAVKSGKVRLWFDGYNELGYVEKPISFKTATTKPIVKLSSTSVNIYNDPENPEDYKEFRVQLIDGKKQPVTGGIVMVDGLESSVTGVDSEGFVTIGINDVSNGKVKVSYTMEGWSGVIDNTISVKVTTSLPTAKLSVTTLNLNSKFKSEGSVNIVPSAAIDISSAAYVVTSGDPDGVSASFYDGQLVVESETVGTYKLQITPSIDTVTGELALKPVTLTVKVTNADPKFSVAAPKLNIQTNDVAEVVPKLTYIGSETLYDIEAVAQSSDVVDMFYNSETGMIEVIKKENTDLANGTYKYSVTPIYDNGENGAPVTVSVTLTDAAPTAKATVKGALNQLDLAQTMSATVKLTNTTSKIIGYYFNDERLVVSMNEDGSATIALRHGVEVIDSTISTDLMVVTDNAGVIKAPVKVKVARKAPSVKAVPATVNMYDMSIDRTYEVLMSYAGDAKIAYVEVVDQKMFEISENSTGNGILIAVDATDAAYIKSGASVTVQVKLHWEGDYDEKKATAIKVALKDSVSAIKGTVVTD